MIARRTIRHFVGLAALAVSVSAHAGRPLTVDDANVNDVGAGHVEMWYSRLPGKINTWNVAPAYSPIKEIEFSALVSRDMTGRLTTTAAQAKWRMTASNPDGCNLGMTLGISHGSGGIGNSPYVNGIATCNHKGGAFHLNFGISHPNGSKALGNWGVAYEREISGMTAHVEVFGQEEGKPTTQLGLRKDIAQGLQLDGTVGRSDGDTVFSVGLKKSF